MQDRYRWAVKYDDLTIAHQRKRNPETGEDDIVPFEDIDRHRLRVFYLLDTHNEMKPFVKVEFDGDGENLVWTRRGIIKPGIGTILHHIVGKKGRFIMLVDPSGGISVVNNFKENEALLSPTTEFKRKDEESNMKDAGDNANPTA